MAHHQFTVVITNSTGARRYYIDSKRVPFETYELKVIMCRMFGRHECFTQDCTSTHTRLHSSGSTHT